MELQVRRDTQITISMTEQEATELMALLNIPSRGVLPIADELYDAMNAEEVAVSIGATDNLHAHFNEVFA